jgi:hypothetical protein
MKLLVFGSLSPSSLFLGFNLDLQFGGAPRTRKCLYTFIYLLGSGVISISEIEVHFTLIS